MKMPSIIFLLGAIVLGALTGFFLRMTVNETSFVYGLLTAAAFAALMWWLGRPRKR